MNYSFMYGLYNELKKTFALYVFVFTKIIWLILSKKIKVQTKP